jgi:hypothetical protein
MGVNIVFVDSAFKHGYTEEDIKFALKTEIRDILMDGFTNKYLVIGFSKALTLIEVMYNYIDENNIRVFHAMDCRKEIKKQLGIL